jgi:hypothetical protein
VATGAFTAQSPPAAGTPVSFTGTTYGLGGDGPTTTIATGAVNPAAPQKLLLLPSQPAATLASAEKAACEYPGSAAGD